MKSLRTEVIKAQPGLSQLSLPRTAERWMGRRRVFRTRSLRMEGVGWVLIA